MVEITETAPRSKVFFEVSIGGERGIDLINHKLFSFFSSSSAILYILPKISCYRKFKV